MRVVIDATVAVALANPFDPCKVEVGARLAMWDRQGAELHAPELLPYEFAAAVRRLADRLRGQLWTLDRRLARDAGRLGFSAVVVEW